MIDPVEQIAAERLIALSAEVEVQLDKNAQTRPLVWLLAQARKTAAAAIVQLVIADANDAPAIRGLQSEIAVYDDLVKHMKSLLERGKEADRMIGEEERSAIAEVILTSADRDQARLLNLEPQDHDT